VLFRSVDRSPSAFPRLRLVFCGPLPNAVKKSRPRRAVRVAIFLPTLQDGLSTLPTPLERREVISVGRISVCKLPSMFANPPADSDLFLLIEGRSLPAFEPTLPPELRCLPHVRRQPALFPKTHRPLRRLAHPPPTPWPRFAKPFPVEQALPHPPMIHPPATLRPHAVSVPDMRAYGRSAFARESLPTREALFFPDHSLQTTEHADQDFPVQARSGIETR
jgi:hypothetical protein